VTLHAESTRQAAKSPAPDFLRARRCSDILLFAAMATVAQVVWVPIAHFAIMTGRASVYFKATTIALAVQQLAFLLFIPHYGVMAALFGFALSRMLSFLITFGVLRHRGALVSAQ